MTLLSPLENFSASYGTGLGTDSLLIDF